MYKYRSILKIACGISGGVDSAVSALLLKREGHEVLGVFMKNWDIRDETGFCQSDQDREDAEFACKKIGIPLVETNFVKEYWNDVFCEMINEYENGRTPNPDILCNQKIKFNVFHDFCIKRLGVDIVATGHYARISAPMPTGVKLLRPVDLAKDQTFFLSRIPQEALQKTIFPVGSLRKIDVKRIALEAGLQKIVQRKESMGICFIGERKFQDFISEYVSTKKGSFICAETGAIVGKHKGIHMWTIGQNCKIVPSNHSSLPKPYFVQRISRETQDIYVVEGTSHPALFSDSVLVEEPFWIQEIPETLLVDGRFECMFRFQQVDPLVNCTLRYHSNNWTVHLERPLRAISPGQYAVFYSNDVCLGSAKIIHTGSSVPCKIRGKFSVPKKQAIESM